jgi:hypothetical protein
MVFQTEDRTRAKKQQADAAIQMALQGEWEKAAGLNRAILESFPTDVDAYNRLGKALTELGRFSDARDAYMRAVEIDPLNLIARKNLSRLATLGKDKAAPKGKAKKVAGQKLSPQMFIEETGKTGVTILTNADMEVANRLTAGDEVKLSADKKGNLSVQTMAGERIGDVEPRLGQRLVKLMEGGNQYVAAISSLLEDGVKIFIRETFQDASQTGKLSFPPTVTESVRPYVKSRLVRSDGDEERAAAEEAEDIEDWLSDDDLDEGADEAELGITGGRLPRADLDDESEE